MSAEAERPSDLIPTPNVTTSDVTQIYPRESIIPSAEWSTIDVKPIAKAKDERSRAALLPSRHSNWIFKKMGEVIRGPSETQKANL
jgi:DNA-directed RNA polymerase I subunit RPA49